MNKVPKVCKDNEELNPLTGRCRKKCNENEVRDQKTGRCKKVAKKPSRKPSTKKVPPTKVCKDKEELNPLTGRCRKKCNENEVRDQKTGRCKKVAKKASRKPSRKPSTKKSSSPKSKKVPPTKVCKDKEELNPLTGRCRKKCNENEVRDQKTGRCKKVAKKPSRKASSRKASSRKPSSRKASSRKASSRKPSSDYEDAFEPLSPIKTYPLIKASPKEIIDDFYIYDKFILKNQNDKTVLTKNKNLTPLEYLMNNDAQNFKEYFNNNPNESFFYSDKGEPLILEAISHGKQKILDSIVEMEINNREKGKYTCYQIYSTRYLKLLESLSTPKKQVDFYAENWSFDKQYVDKGFSIHPLNIIVNNSCFFDRREQYQCDFPKIRWQSGDPRKRLRNIMGTVELFIQTDKLYNLDLVKEDIESVLPFVSSLQVVNNTIKFDTENFLNKNPLFRKELSKQYDIEQTIKMLDNYIHYCLESVNPNEINKVALILDMYKKNSFPEYIKDHSKQLEMNVNIVYSMVQRLKNKLETNPVGYDFCLRLLLFLSSLIILESFLLDVYTILRLFKNIPEKPYYVYCYFGDIHVEHLIHYFTYVMKSYKLVISKKSQCQNKMCRCISFEPKEYVENSKEIRKLSGPVSFYRLQAIDKNIRPQYITLFGDYHGSDREQCKECNFDYLKLYKQANIDRFK